jgi:hypothetical protein
MDRRSALRRLGAIAAGLCASGCSRGFVLGVIYPEAAEFDQATVDRLLEAFVTTIVPEADRPAQVARLLRDPTLPFAELAGPLAADLARRTSARVGHGDFDRLALPMRTAVVAEGIDGGGIPSRIYQGAVLFTQAAVYSGLACDDGSCSITGFEGPFRFRGHAEQTYPDPDHFLPAPVSPDGNPW